MWVIFCVIGRGYLLWPVHSLGKTMLAFALLLFVFQDLTCPLLQVPLDFLFLHSSLLWWKGHFFFILVLKGLVGLYRTVQLHLLLLEYRRGLLWRWMICLGNELRSFHHFWDCIQVLHFRLLLTMRSTPFLLRNSCPQ